MDWQQITSLVLVALAATLLLRSWVRRRRQAALGICEEDCGCAVNDLVKKIPEDQLRRMREQQNRIARP